MWTYNPFTQNLDKTSSEAELDDIYLRLDTTNGPLTGDLTISKDNPELFLDDTTSGKKYGIRSIANSLEFLDRTLNIRRGVIDTSGNWFLGGTISDSAGSGATVKIVGTTLSVHDPSNKMMLDGTTGFSHADSSDNRIQPQLNDSTLYFSGETDGATAVGHVFDTTDPLSTAGGLLTSFRNDGTQKFSIDLNGFINGGGTTNQIFGMNSGATAHEYKSVVGTANQVIVGHAANTITLSGPQNLGTASTPQFGQLGIGTAVGGANLITLSADGVIGTTGGLTINLSNTVDKTLVLQNSGAGVANMTMDGSLTVGDSISFVSATHKGLIVQTGAAFGVAADDNNAGIFFSSVSSGSLEFRNTAGTVMFSQVAVGTTNLADFIRDVRARQFVADGDNAGIASTISITGTSNLTANNIGIGTVLMKGTTSRNSAGFAKIYIGTVAYYVPVFDAITG